MLIWFVIVPVVLISRVEAPLLCVRVPVPSALTEFNRSLPALRVTPPVLVFAPERVRRPAPIFVSPPAPPMVPLTVRSSVPTSI